MFPAGGHNGCDEDLIGIIFKGDHPRGHARKKHYFVPSI
jgi:hypothetical protein